MNAAGFQHYKADEEITCKDIMCKICEQIQACRMAIINISGLNPNVMLELGLAYGLGKPVYIVKDKATKAISDLGSIEYIEYSHATETIFQRAGHGESGHGVSTVQRYSRGSRCGD